MFLCLLFLFFFFDILYINVIFFVEFLYKSFLDRFLMVLVEKFVVLNYILGLFDLKEVLLVLGIKVVDDFFLNF